MPRTYGQINYEAFGQPLWPWVDLEPEIKQQWERAAWTAINAYQASHAPRESQRDTLPDVNWNVLAIGECDPTEVGDTV